MNILIFSKSHIKAEKFFDDLIGEIKYKNILRVRKSSNECYAELKDGSLIKIVHISTTAIGYKCDKAFVDKDIDMQSIKQIIIPTLCMSKLPQEEQVKYF